MYIYMYGIWIKLKSDFEYTRIISIYDDNIVNFYRLYIIRGWDIVEIRNSNGAYSISECNFSPTLVHLRMFSAIN